MTAKEELAKVCNLVYEKGYVAAFDGNLSIRVGSNRILITPSGKNKGEIKPDDLLLIDLSGNTIEGDGEPSTESKIHLFGYKYRPEVNAIVHAHPIFATAFATIGESLNKPVFPEVVLTLGKVPLCKYATPSTEQVTDSMQSHIEYAWAFLLENHGAVSFGKSIMDAFYKMEKLEHACKILAIARTLGRERQIPLLKLKELYSIAESTYGINIHPKNRMDY
ncbi:MAG: class II aldolase/adducin family protein [Melioribacteraceae bacterium]|nr:class II aldolase/adducin family protein [Melioribacteraceae bacterium]